MNLPNKLTILRVLMIPIFLWVLLGKVFGEQYFQVASALIFAVASATDALDGWIARKYNLITNFGKFMDPLADKLLVNAAIIAFVQMGRLSAVVAIILISREFVVTGFRLVAVEQRIVIAAGFWGKVKTVTQMAMIILVILNIPAFAILTQILIYASVILSIVSGVEYIYVNRKVLKDVS